MMNYEMFKEIVKEQFLNHMPEEFADHQISIHPVDKVNQRLDAINVLPPDNTDMAVIPNIYVNYMYEHYQQCRDLNETLDTAAVNYVKAYKEAPVNYGEQEYKFDKRKIVMALVNKEQNEELLNGVPNRAFQDLSVIYRYVVDDDQRGLQTTIINNALAERMEMTEEALFQSASENTKRLFPPMVKSMNEVMHDIFASEGMPEEMISMFAGEMPPEQCMYVIGNERGINGAASMLYEDELHKLAEKLDTDLYILPSSLHEVIAVSVDLGDPNELAEMVAEINMNQVQLGERLSNQVYHYDKDLRKLSLATDTPNKRLDGIVTEIPMIYETKQSR